MRWITKLRLAFRARLGRYVCDLVAQHQPEPQVPSTPTLIVNAGGVITQTMVLSATTTASTTYPSFTYSPWPRAGHTYGAQEGLVSHGTSVILPDDDTDDDDDQRNE